MDIAITKMSSKGQVVIPTEMRENLLEGEKLVLIKSKGQFIIKRAKDFSKSLEKDLEFAKRTNDALKRIDDGKGIKKDFDEFIGEMETW